MPCPVEQNGTFQDSIYDELEGKAESPGEPRTDAGKQKLAILPNGRYELQLPWKHDPVNLPDNKGLTWARHEKVIKG
ncbi:hypothetical protein TNCV_1835981 [Trichonephila clavipes]|nr:hypothetical protein TNCV_1835981 [Trichonephila clavipes]